MQIRTNYESHNYDIVIAHGAINNLKSIKEKTIVIIDAVVMQLFKDKVKAALNDAIVIEVSGGEETKTLGVYERVINEILSQNVTRDVKVIAIGGGSTGDFAGFIAATLLRGVSFIQVPTTILAHDSAIGGKVGLNSIHGKNLIGAFKRPDAVYYDLDFLESLPAEEVLSGFAEVIKHAMLSNQLDDLQTDFPDAKALLSLNHMDKWLLEGIKIKRDIVVQDEFEKDVRKTLNLGHTFGHAAEFHHHIPHGHAVLLGLIYTYILSGKDAAALYEWFTQLGFKAPELETFETYETLMKKDKKNAAEKIQFILLGDAPYLDAPNHQTLSAAFNQLKELVNSAKS